MSFELDDIGNLIPLILLKKSPPLHKSMTSKPELVAESLIFSTQFFRIEVPKRTSFVLVMGGVFVLPEKPPKRASELGIVRGEEGGDTQRNWLKSKGRKVDSIKVFGLVEPKKTSLSHWIVIVLLFLIKEMGGGGDRQDFFVHT